MNGASRRYFSLVGGKAFWACAAALLAARELCVVLSDLWLASGPAREAAPERFFSVYAVLFAGAIVLSALAAGLLLARALKAACALHVVSVDRFLGDSLAHLRGTPDRAHLARLIHDQGVVDRNAGPSAAEFASAASGLGGAAALIACMMPSLAPLFILLGLVYWKSARAYRRDARRWAAVASDASGGALTAARDLAAGVVWLRGAGWLEEWRVRRFEREQARLEEALAGSDASERGFSLRMELIGAAMFSMVCVGAAWRVRRGARFDAAMGLAMTYATVMTAGLGRAVKSLADVDRDAVSARNILEAGPEAPPSPGRAAPRDATVVFSDVGFSYPGSAAPALRGVTFRVRAGERVVVIGRTGSGKSTLAALCAGLWSPTSGSVRVGGRPVHEIPPHGLDRCVHMVPQHPVFFPGRLRDSLAPRRLPESRIWAALDAVGAAADVESLPGRLDFPIAPGGAPPLSASRRRRLFLAGAVLGAAPIAVLDEPTQGLSPDEAGVLIDRVLESLEGRTLIVVTHHWSLASRFDGTIELEGGTHVLRLRG